MSSTDPPPGVPVLRRRHEPGADRRGDPGRVPQGALPRYVPASPSPAGSTHRPPEPSSAPARELSTISTPAPHAPSAPARIRPCPGPGVPTSRTPPTNVTRETFVRARLYP